MYHLHPEATEITNPNEITRVELVKVKKDSQLHNRAKITTSSSRSYNTLTNKYQELQRQYDMKENQLKNSFIVSCTSFMHSSLKMLKKRILLVMKIFLNLLKRKLNQLNTILINY